MKIKDVERRDQRRQQRTATRNDPRPHTTHATHYVHLIFAQQLKPKQSIGCGVFDYIVDFAFGILNQCIEQTESESNKKSCEVCVSQQKLHKASFRLDNLRERNIPKPMSGAATIEPQIV